jgi:2-dehydropantoate 2-reductase
MHFLIHGTGGVGGYFGAKLLGAGEEVTFLARGKHLEASQKNGLRVLSTQGNFTIPPNRVVGNLNTSAPVDVVLFCVKTYDTETAAQLLAPVLSEQTVIIPLQNGIESEERIRRVIPKGIVYGGVAYISSRITAPGEITETGGAQRIAFGPMDVNITNRANEILSVFQKANINTELKTDIVKDLWRKFAFITTMGAFTAVSRLTQGELLAVPESMELIFAAMEEVHTLANAKGIGLEPLDHERVVAGIKRYDPNTRSSMYYDLVNEKPLEVEALNGTVVRLGKELNIPTPIHQTIYAALLPYHLKHTGANLKDA